MTIDQASYTLQASKENFFPDKVNTQTTAAGRGESKIHDHKSVNMNQECGITWFESTETKSSWSMYLQPMKQIKRSFLTLLFICSYILVDNPKKELAWHNREKVKTSYKWLHQ